MHPEQVRGNGVVAFLDDAWQTPPVQKTASMEFSGGTSFLGLSMFEVHYLAENPEWIPTLAEWHFSQWGSLNPTNDVAVRIERLQTHLQPGSIPVTFVACEGDDLLGSASLVGSDLDIRPELTPWLASVFVKPTARSQGVGHMLVQRVMREAVEFGVPRLHLFTLDRERFYSSLGWQLSERISWRQWWVAVMTYDFRN